ncbi:MAG: GTPase [Bacilli bacterium]
MTKVKTCIGCGVELQDANMLLEGYVTSVENDLCQRCFRMKNYGEYQIITKSNEDYINILKSVGKTKDLVLFIVDLCNLDKDINYIREYISNNTILVLNKRDVLPKSVKDEKILEYIRELTDSYLDIVIISCKNNYQLDLLYSKIEKYKNSKKVYVVGHTNVGKSSLINQMMKNYSDDTRELTISPLPSTTLNKVEIKLNKDLTLIDTPGLVDRGNLVNYIDNDTLKRVNSKVEMKPSTFAIKKGQCLIIDDLARIDYVAGEKNSFTVYMSNNVVVKKMNALKQDRLKDLAKTSYDMKYRDDLVINGLGWVKVVDKCQIDLYIDKNVEVFTRDSII